MDFSYWLAVPRVWIAFAAAWLAIRFLPFARVPCVWVRLYCIRVRFGVSISKSTAKVLQISGGCNYGKIKMKKIFSSLYYKGMGDIPNSVFLAGTRGTTHSFSSTYLQYFLIKPYFFTF